VQLHRHRTAGGAPSHFLLSQKKNLCMPLRQLSTTRTSRTTRPSQIEIDETMASDPASLYLHSGGLHCRSYVTISKNTSPPTPNASLRPGGDVFSTKHDITATLRVAEYGERVRLFCQMGRGMNPWAIGIASNMYFINRIKLIPLFNKV
jgi:hypothetical protein